MNGNNDNNLSFLMGNQGNYGYNQGMDPMMGNQNSYGYQYPNNNFGGQPANNLDFLMGGTNPNPNPNMGNMGMDPMMGNQNNNMDNNAFQDTNNDDSEKNEMLFGVPMYDDKKEDKKIDESNLFAPETNSFAPQQPYGFPGMGMNNDYGLGNMPPIIHNDNMGMAPSNETLFGAPMYDSGPMDQGMDNARTDIFGQLLTPEGNMRIKGGRIVDDFSKVNIPPQDGNLMQSLNQANYGYNQGMDPMMGNQNMYGNPNPYNNNQFSMNQNPYMNNNNQFGMNQNPYMNNNNQFGMNQNPYMNNNQFGMNQNPYMNNNQFGMNQNPYGMGMNMYPGYGMPRGPIFNELKVEDNLNQNIVKEEPEEEPKEEKIKPTPRVDLNLETGNNDEEEFDE